MYTPLPATSWQTATEMKDLFHLEAPDDLDRLRTAWDGMLKRLGPEVPAAWFQRFIRPLKPVAFEKGVAIVHVPGKFIQEWVRERYVATIQTMVSDELGEAVLIELRPGPHERNKADEPDRSVRLAAPAAAEPTFRPSERFTFDTFVAGQSNRMALAGAKAVAAEPGKKFNPLFIYGPSGLGKTHLLHAIAWDILRTSQPNALAYLTAQQFAEEFVSALQTGRMEAFRRSQRAVDVWLVDDIQFVAGKDKTQEEIFHTFNYLHSLGKQIVLTSDRPPRDLYLMDERLRGRFEAGLVADVQMPDTETRCAILLSKAGFDRVQLDHEIAMYLAEHIPGSIRSLEGALNKLVAQASIEARPLSLEVAKKLVDQYYRSDLHEKPAFEQIVAAVSKQFKIPSEDILGTSRKAPIVLARHVAVYATREITGDSWNHIGGLFGDRDHTSMMHGYQRVSEAIQQDRELRAHVKALIRNLQPSQ